MRQWLEGRARSLLARLLMSYSKGRVLQGPFRGMIILGSRYPGRTLRLLLGTHELELHPVIEGFVGAGPRTIINCGAARGYYAVGLALRCPGARVIAFEAVAEMRADLARAAHVNGVSDRVSIRGACGPASLQASLAAAPAPVLVLVDIEGDEVTTFDSATVAHLAQALVLIETHDARLPGTTERLLGGFAGSHVAEVYRPRDRTHNDIPPALATRGWHALPWLLMWVMSESRPTSQQWLLFTPR